MTFHDKNRGFTLIEAILGLAIFVLIVSGLASALIYAWRSGAVAGDRQRAVFYAAEGLEATRNIRDASFANLVDGVYGLAVSANVWTFSGSSDSTGIFQRQISISTVDANTKQITSSVTWPQLMGNSGNVVLTDYLTYWQKAVSGIGNWGSPLETGSGNLTGNTDGHRVEVVGNYAYVTRFNASPNFAIFDITSADSPVLLGTRNLQGDAHDLFISGNYAYIASTDNSQELQIVNISNPNNPVLSATYNAAGNGDARSVFVSGSVAYLGRVASADNELWAINISNPLAPTLLGSVNSAYSIEDIYISGNYAYLACLNSASELQVANVTNPASMTIPVQYNVTGVGNGSVVTGFGTTLLLGTTATNLLAIINISNPLAPGAVSTFNTVANVNGMSLGNDNKYVFLATADAAQEFKVVDITAPALPVQLGFVNLASTLNDVFYSVAKDRVYCASTDNTKELLIIAPQ